MRFTDFMLLLEIANNEESLISTTKLSKKLGVSQQTISRKIREFEKDDIVERKVISKGQYVTLTKNGRNFLMSIYLKMSNFVTKTNGSFSFSGIVVSGSGEGRYYIGLKNYFSQFKKKLGFSPYKGTLNILVEPFVRIKIERKKAIYIEGFKHRGRTFGGIFCYPCKIDDEIIGAVIVPERTHHPEEIVELISPFNLRKKLSLRDGDKIKVKII